MGAFAKWVVIAAVLALAATARAEDYSSYPSEAPRAIHIGAVAGLSLRSMPSSFDPTFNELETEFLSGFDIGVQHIKGGVAFSIDGDILPIGSIYRARAAIVLGHGFTTSYSEPCIGPPGYSCAKIWSGRRVRSIVGLKLGVGFGYERSDTVAALEAGIAVRSQFSLDFTGLYDPVRGVPGLAFDFEWQIGSFYVGIDARGMLSDREPVAFTTSFKLGWAMRMWK